jgi:predicted acylesterase/phospholipase RssA
VGKHRSAAKEGAGPFDLDAVLAAESKAIGVARPDCGLALSGGGVRSATFNLGVLQALSELRWLRAFDYLSTVSGGGYIGSWLTALVHHLVRGDPAQAEAAIAPRDPSGAPQPDHAAVRYLRDYASYLTPHRGLLSGDTWMAISTYLRNFELNLVCVVLLLACPLILLRLWVPGIERLGSLLGHWHVAALFALLAPANVAIALSLPSGGRSLADDLRCRGHVVAVFISACAIVASVLLSHFMLVRERGDLTGDLFGFERDPLPPWAQWIALGLVLYAFQWLFGAVFYLWRRHRHADPADRRPMRGQWGRLWLAAALPAAGAGVVGGVMMALQAKLTYWIAHLGFVWPPAAPGVAAYHDPFAIWWSASVGGGISLLLVFGGTVVAHNGLAGRAWSDADREWWARLGGWVLAVAIAWTALCTLALLFPAFIGWAHSAVVAAGGAGWLMTTGAGLLLSLRDSGAPEGGKAAALRAAAIAIAPYVFVLGLLGLLSFAVHAALLTFDGRALPEYPADMTWLKILQASTLAFDSVEVSTIVLGASLCGALALLACWRVDVNVFSLTSFYRDRLSRCYLGASRAAAGERKPDDFIGLDPKDDLPLAQIAAGHRPFPILCATLNIVRGVELAWQDRKAASFTFTPLHAGFWLPTEGADPRPGQRTHGSYRPASGYLGGVTIANAMAISGAALSPLMGYHTNPGVAFLLTVFDLRLGRWCGNPTHPTAWRHASPPFGAWCLLGELFGLTSRTSSHVYLSDGGHFDNTGIYELVRRRCRYIVACDAEHDPEYEFPGVAGAIRKCHADFGVRIDIDLEPLRAPGDTRRSPAAAQVGYIRYPATAAEPAFEGRLLLIKSTLTGYEPADVASYGAATDSFPHVSTANQMFDEDAFESYRKLGYFLTTSSIARLRDDARRRADARLRDAPHDAADPAAAPADAARMGVTPGSARAREAPATAAPETLREALDAFAPVARSADATSEATG